jgi:hypothetical protein
LLTAYQIELLHLMTVPVHGRPAEDRLAGQTPTARARVHRQEDPCRQDDVVTAAVLPDGSPDDLLRRGAPIDVRGFPEGRPEFDGLPELVEV